MSQLYSRIQETVEALKARGLGDPSLLVIYWGKDGNRLIPGLGEVCDLGDLPHCPERGRILAGAGSILLEDAPSFHDGFSMEALAQLPRALSLLGLGRLVLLGPVKMLEASREAEDLVLVADHLNLTGDSPLAGPHEARLGKRFPDMGEAWSMRLRALAKAEYEGLGEGVLAGLSGPGLETPAQLAYLKKMGADMADWRFLPENQAAVHAGLEVLGLGLPRLGAGGETPSSEISEVLSRIIGAVQAC